jgi:hypothetical protein
LAEIDDTITAGAKEDWAVQPAPNFHEGATNEELVFGEMDERGISERLKNGNVLDPREPTFAIVVGQENEIVTMKYVSLALRSSSRRSLRLYLDCH